MGGGRQWHERWRALLILAGPDTRQGGPLVVGLGCILPDRLRSRICPGRRERSESCWVDRGWREASYAGYGQNSRWCSLVELGMENGWHWRDGQSRARVRGVTLFTVVLEAVFSKSCVSTVILCMSCSCINHLVPFPFAWLPLVQLIPG